MLATQSPFPQYFDTDGSPLDAGRLYFGQVDQNPETAPIAVYWDAAGTQPAAQPIQTLNGYTYRSGTPAQVYAAVDYSLTIRDRRGRQVLYSPDSSEFSLSSAITAGLAALRADIANTADATKGDFLIGVKQPLTGAVPRTQHDKNFEIVSIADFGVLPDGGIANQSANLQTAVDKAIAGRFLIEAPPGEYRFDDPIVVSIPSSEAELFWLSGDLTGTKFIFGGTGDFITLRGAIGYLDMGPRVRISEITFETAPGVTATSLIRNELAINVELDHLHFAGTKVSEAHIINEKAYGLELSYSVFRYVTGDGVKLLAAPADTEYSYVVGIRKCDFSHVDGTCIYVEGCANLLVTHTIMQQSMRGVLFNSAATSNFTFNAVFDTCWTEQNVISDFEAPSNANYWAEFTLRNHQFGFRSATLGGPATLPALVALDSRSRVTILGTTVWGGVTCNISGSGGAAATLFDAVGFAQIGTFAWASFGRAGARATMFTSDSGIAAAVPNNTATTLKFMPTDASSYNQVHLVSATVSSGSAAAYSAAAIITSSGLVWRITPLQTATNLALSISVEQLRVTQTSGAPADVMWTLTRLS